MRVSAMRSGKKNFHIRRKSIKVHGVVEVMVRERGWYEKIQEGRVFNIWESVVGKPIAAQTNPVSLKSGVLRVDVAHPVYANELSLMKTEILSKIESKLEDMGFFRQVSPERNRLVDVQFRFNPNVVRNKAKMSAVNKGNGDTSKSGSKLSGSSIKSVSPDMQEQIEFAISKVNDLELRDTLKTLFITQCNEMEDVNK